MVRKSNEASRTHLGSLLRTSTACDTPRTQTSSICRKNGIDDEQKNLRRDQQTVMSKANGFWWCRWYRLHENTEDSQFFEALHSDVVLLVHVVHQALALNEFLGAQAADVLLVPCDKNILMLEITTRKLKDGQGTAVLQLVQHTKMSCFGSCSLCATP